MTGRKVVVDLAVLCEAAERVGAHIVRLGHHKWRREDGHSPWRVACERTRGEQEQGGGEHAVGWGEERAWETKLKRKRVGTDPPSSFNIILLQPTPRLPPLIRLHLILITILRLKSGSAAG